MILEHQNPTMRLLLLCAFLTGCASSGAPAPVEQREPVTAGRTNAASPAQTRAGDQEAGTPVQLSGLGDESAGVAVPQGVTVPRSAAGEQTEPRAAAANPSPEQIASVTEPVTDFPVDNPAVVALLNRANREAAAGRQGASASSLERAIKIEPGNAWLWHRLAQVRLTQKQPAEAAALAARSNSLAGDDNSLRARNWRLIASVHLQRGERVAAQAAQSKAEGLERGAS